MIAYRCFLRGTNGHFRDAVRVSAPTDSEALVSARMAIADEVQSGFELWQGDRLVHIEGEASIALNTELQY